MSSWFIASFDCQVHAAVVGSLTQPPLFSNLRAFLSPLAAQRTAPCSLSLSLSLSLLFCPAARRCRRRRRFYVPLFSGSPYCASSFTVEATVVLARDRSPAWMAATRCSPFLPRCCCCSQSELRARPSEGKKVHRRSAALELFGPGIVST